MIEEQKAIAAKVRIEDDFSEIRTVCGLDVSSNFFQREAPLHAAAVLIDIQTLEVIEAQATSRKPEVPYRTGFLAFREAPVMIEALQKLSIKPDLLIIDGHGIAHPRRCGIASHVGVLVDLPSIGVGKTLLIGDKKMNRLFHREEQIGWVLQSKKRAKPLFISSGHRVSQPSALALVKQLILKHRLPEPTRLAHESSNRQRILFNTLNV